MTDVIGLIILGIVTVGALWYLHKNAPAVPNGSSALHYHPVSAHTVYKKDTK